MRWPKPLPEAKTQVKSCRDPSLLLGGSFWVTYTIRFGGVGAGFQDVRLCLKAKVSKPE